MTERRATWLALAGGLALLVVAQLGRSAMMAPLYDGIPVEEPYRYLAPLAGAAGNPSSATDSVPVEAGVAPSLFVATTETPPQAQLITDRDAFALPPGATSVKVTLEPVPPPALPSVGVIMGNVYRVTVTDQAGSPLSVRKGATVTLVLRAPVAVSGAEIFSFTGSSWNRLATQSGGLPDIYAANVAGTGDFAVIAPADAASLLPAPTPQPFVPVSPAPSGGMDATPFVILGVALGLALLSALELWQRRRRNLAAHAPGPRRTRDRPDG